MRLHTRVRDTRRTPVPFGLKGWTEGAVDVAVLLETAREDWPSLAAVAAQLPDAAALPADATVVVFGGAVRAASSWRRWLGDGVVLVPRSVRCGALLVRGYVDIGATIGAGGDDFAWGRVAGR